MNFNELLNMVSSNNTPDICLDSRAVRDGDIFVAVKGTACDGHDFIEQALANGAEYIVCQQASSINGWQPHPDVVDRDGDEAATLSKLSKTS